MRTRRIEHSLVDQARTAEATMAASEAKTRLVCSLRGGRMTIPVEFRKALGIGADSVLQVTMDQGELRIKPLAVRETAAGSPWFRAFYDYFAPARQEADEK